MEDHFKLYSEAAHRYQELVSYEDAQNQLTKTLLSHVNFEGPGVIEAGVGTGRVTELYAHRAQQIYAYDQSSHMINYARQRFTNYDHIQYAVKHHTDLLEQIPAAHLLIEGWAFGYWFLELFPNFETCLDPYFTQLKRALQSPAQIVLIETLGTNCEQPFQDQPLNIFYDYLENQQGFQRHVLRTDYQFPSRDKMIELMGFFFGAEMSQQLQTQQMLTVPEWTGCWIWNAS